MNFEIWFYKYYQYIICLFLFLFFLVDFLFVLKTIFIKNILIKSVRSDLNIVSIKYIIWIDLIIINTEFKKFKNVKCVRIIRKLATQGNDTIIIRKTSKNKTNHVRQKDKMLIYKVTKRYFGIYCRESKITE